MNRCGPALNLLRERARMSKAELARALKITPSGVSDLLAENAWPTTRRLSQALEALGATVHDLAAALDQVNQRALPALYSEIREGSSSDEPLDQHLAALTAQLRALVDEVKRQRQRP